MEPHNEPTTGKHILLIDDDSLMLRLFSGNLARAGFQVIQAHDGNEGREMARRLQPDLILLDLRMPVMGGTEALTRMKEEEETKDIPVIIFSNEDLSVEAEKDLMELGAAGYINKSTEPGKVIETLHSVIGL